MSSNCSTGSKQTSQSSSTTDIKQATPFNIGTFGVLFVFCIIIALTSSLYYNWPAIERILVDDKVFQNLCTKDEIYNAIDGMFVCDEQRKQIGNLAIIIFYTEFIAFAIGGILTDIVGVYLVLVLSFIFGFTSFTIMYFYMDNFMIKVSFALWGMFGGFVFITSIQFPKMFPEATSLADGMIILFDNISGLIPIVIYKLMKKFNLKYYEAFGTYILWGIFPSFLLVITFIPYKIMPKNQTTALFDFKNISQTYKCFSNSAGDPYLWTNYIIFSIPVTCSIFYKKTFSTYFLKNQTLVKIFPIIMLFVFVPTIFIAALNQFMGVHITSCILYIFYIISFVCFLYPTKQYGLLSIILFVISTSAAEQQTMTYISENHQQNESTLLGISYAVDFIVGSILQRIFDRIYDRSPKAILYVIIPLFFICIAYSLYCATANCKNGGQSSSEQSKSLSFRGLFLILWFIPFFVLCFGLFVKFNAQSIDESVGDISQDDGNLGQKNLTCSVVFYSLSFYYVYDVFLIIFTIFKISSNIKTQNYNFNCLMVFLICYFIVPQCILSLNSYFNINNEINVDSFIIMLLIFKLCLYYFSKQLFNKNYTVTLFSIFLMIYGFVFFLFIYMLAYYNFQITYSTPNNTTILHWGTLFTVFLIIRTFHNIISEYENGYFIIWIFSFCFLMFFGIALILLTHEKKKIFSSKYFIVKIPSFSTLKIPEDFKNHLYYSIIVNISMTICNFAVLIDLKMSKMIIWVLYIVLFIHLYNVSYSIISLKYDIPEQIFKYSGIGVTGLSVLLFIIILLSKVLIGNNKSHNNIANVIVFVNFIILSISSNICWNAELSLQIMDDVDSIPTIFFFFGNLLGWILFIVYIAVSKSQIIYNSFQ